MSDVEQIKQVDLKPDADLIVFVEKILEKVKSGQIRGMACVTINTENCVGSGWWNVGESIIRVLGAMDILHRDLMDVYVDLKVDPETGERSE